MNRIYRIIWNNALNSWVVTSELGRGKVKSATNKKLAGIGVGLSLLSASVLAAPDCDPQLLTCKLASEWKYATANSGVQTAVIGDGKNYTITGPSIFDSATSNGIITVTVNDAIDQGYITNNTDKINGKPFITFGNKNNSIVLTDPLTGVTSTVSTYNSSTMTQILRNNTVSILDPEITSAPYYYQAGFLKVTDGEATINIGASNISGIFKDTQLVSAESDTKDAKAIWASDNTINQVISTVGIAPVTHNSSYHDYKTSITAFDGSTIAINDLAGLKNYNTWLIQQIKQGDLKGSLYDAELAKAYTLVNVSYLINTAPESTPITDPILTADVGQFAALYGNGSKATVEVTGSLTGTVINNNNRIYSLVLLDNGATGINKGRITSWGYGYGIIVNGGSTFINQGLIDNNKETARLNYLGVLHGAGSHFINDESGIINLSQSTYSSDSEFTFALSLKSGSMFTNKGIMNLTDTSVAIPNITKGIYANSGSVNNEGLMTLGLLADGTAINTAVGSSIMTVTATDGNNQNSGQLVLGENTAGNYAVIINTGNRNADFTNSASGIIDILGEKSDTAAANVGIALSDRTYGVTNAGTINVKGTNNIGMRVLSSAKAISSGIINVFGKQTANNLNNFGLWVEGANSIAEVSGTVSLTGDNAIAIHAKDKGVINLSGAGKVIFNHGENQIGYYIYGADSKIINNSTGAQDVTTNNSTLMRLDGGAAFTGSSDISSTMSASGDNANVIVATGTGSSVDSGGMTVNVKGNKAIGFLIEGGATGTIGSTGTINLSGKGAIAGIADGQGHDLGGVEKVMTDVEKKTTSLTAGANLNSALDGVVGYIARNLATLTNSGNIYFIGDNTTGIQVEEGAVGANSGNMTLGGMGAVGLKASADTLATILSSTGNLTLNSSWDGLNDETRTTGVLADGSQVSVTIGNGINAAEVNLNGTGTVGVHASAGSTVTLNDNVAVNFDINNSDQIAFWVDGNGSKIITKAGTTNTQVNGDGVTLFYVTDTATLNGVLNLNLSGKAGSDKITSGIRVSGVDSLATLAGGSQLTIGTNATGVLAENAGKAVIDAGSQFNISGDRAIVGKASGVNSQVENNALVTSVAGSSGSTAFLAENGGEIDNKGTIDLSIGSRHTAIDLNNGHLVNRSNIQANGTAIHIKGSDSTITNSGTGEITAAGGKAAIHVDTGAGLNLSAISGSTGTIKAKGTADGILLDEGALSLNVANTVIDMSDASSSGIGIHNVAGIEGIRLDNTYIKLGGTGIGIQTGASLAQANSGQIDVTDGTGILYLNEDRTNVAANLDFSDSANLEINVIGSGIGVKASLDGNNRSVNTGVSVNVKNATGGSAIDVSGAKTVVNSGVLVSQSTAANGNVLNVHDAEIINNSGTITASSMDIAAIAMSNVGDKAFTNTGDIHGLLDFTSGDNLINLIGGTLTGRIKANGGANTLIASEGAKHLGEIILAGTKAQNVTVSDASEIGHLVMVGGGNHRITLSESSSVGNVTLGDGVNQLTVDSSTMGNITTGNGENGLTFSGTSEAGAITLGTGNNNLTLSGSAQIARLIAGAGGNNAVLVKDMATFGTLDAGSGGTNNSLTFDGTNYTLADSANIQRFDLLNLINGADFTTAQAIQMGDTATSFGRIAIDGTSSLILNSSGDYTLNHALSGHGLIAVHSGSEFNFGGSAGDQFTGIVQMNSARFALSNSNTNALANATLKVMSDNTTIVGEGNQVIGGLIFNGGSVDFGISIPGATTADNRIQVNTLDASGTGNIKVTHTFIDSAVAPSVSQVRGLLDQQTNTIIQLVSATTVTGAAGNLVLTDELGNVISNANGTAVYQSGTHAANGHYDYRLTTVDNNRTAGGLYVGYGLTELELLANGGHKLVINTAHSAEKVLSAKVTGSGDFGIDAGDGADAFILSNLNNTYTGITDVKNGTVILGADNGFGTTSKLSLAGTTTANINGKTQTIGALDAKSGSTLDLKGGDLTLTANSTSSGSLTGSGNLRVSANATLTVTNANIGLSATTTVNAGAQALLEDLQALGAGNIITNGEVTLIDTSGTFANALSGSGKLNSYAGSDVTLSGDNRNFSGIVGIDNDSRLTIGEAKHIGGAIGIINGGNFISNNSTEMSLAADISGNGNLIKQNSGTLILRGTNTYSGQTDIQSGIVSISADENLGGGRMSNQTLLNGGDLQITADLASLRDISLVKNGSVIVDGGVTASMSGWDDQSNGSSTMTKTGDGTLIWTGNNSTNAAKVNVASGTLQVAELNNLASAIGEINLDSGGTLSIMKANGDTTNVDFTRQLSGSGQMLVNLGGKAQELSMKASSIGGNFTGQVTMNNGLFVLNNDADNALAQATLQLNTNGSTQLMGNHTIGGLTLNGGQLEVEFSRLNHLPEGLLTANTLDVVGGGNLAITTPGNLPNPIPVTGVSLFDQDDRVFDVVVRATNSVNGVGTQIAVTKLDGTSVAPDSIVGLIQDGTTAGNAYYSYFGSVKGDGLYLGFGLTQIDAFAGQSVILDNSSAIDNALGAKLTGNGGFTIKANGTVRIGNASSDYLGATDLNSGNIELITHNSLGQTSALNMQSGTGLDLNGNRQVLGSLAAMAGSVINLNNGELTITNGGLNDGTFIGQGKLILTGNTLSLNQNSSHFIGTTEIEFGTTARLTKPQGLGRGIINNAGILNLDTAKGTLFNNLNGSGATVLNNGADIYLGGNNTGYGGTFTTHTGTTLTATEQSQLGIATIDNRGTFAIDTSNLWTLDNIVSGNGTLVKKGNGTLQLEADNISAGLTNIENGLLLVGGAANSTQAVLKSDVTIGKNGALGGYGSVIGDVTSGGNLIMGHALTGGTHGQFIIDGNYTGTDSSTITFNSTLDGDSSSTDILRITGNTEGNSKVVVLSARGEGAQTQNGIKLIDVQGRSNAQFTLSGRAIAGAYEYFLYQGGIATPADGDWYLRSSLSSLSPDPSVYRPEAGGYMANMAAAGNLFSLRLADREGRAENSSLWLRQEGSRNKHRDGSGQLRTATNSYVVQGGGEVFTTQLSDTDRFGLGVMMAYGQADSKVHSQKTGYKANSIIDGYSSGVYGTWYQDAKTLNGAYVDSWVQYSWLDAEVNGQDVAKESYDMDGFSASIEAGYRLPVYQGVNGDVFITPQGQIAWNGITADDHIETGGTKASSSGHDNVQTRLGVKVSRDGVSDKDKGIDKLFTLYAEANWLHNSQQAGAILDGTEVKQSGSRNVAELKLGSEGQLNQNINLWSNVAQRMGDNGYSDTAVTFGVKYRF